MRRPPHRPCADRSRVVAACAVVAALTLAACGSSQSSPGRSSDTPARASRSAAPTSASSSSGAPSSPPATSPSADPAAVRRADTTIARLTHYLGPGGVSIEAVDTRTGVTFRYGARHGMLCGSIAKLYILETLLLQHQQRGRPLTDATNDLATRMIENSDNDAANDLYVDIGEGPALRRAAGALGVRHTKPGSGIYWGFSRTSAADFVALLRNLRAPGALDAASRRYALHLLSHVESDQRWGVGTVADPGTAYYLKNGWLGADPDGGRWLVNTVGIVTVHGDRLLMAVLTQHGTDFDSGVDLVDRLSHVTARVVTAR